MSIISIDGAKELVEELKNNGYKVYLLSNASINQKNYWSSVPGSEFFDGVLVSSFIKIIKPQPEIYEYLLNKYNLKREECVFIDDSTQNVEASEYVGMKGGLFFISITMKLEAN